MDNSAFLAREAEADRLEQAILSDEWTEEEALEAIACLGLGFIISPDRFNVRVHEAS